MSRAFDALTREIHQCPVGLTCRPGRGVLYPTPPQGRYAPPGPDILLVGWNPRTDAYARYALPDIATFRAEAQGKLADLEKRDAQEAKNLRGILPETYPLDSSRLMRTYLWKWPTRVKTSTGESAFYAEHCMRDHFEKELDILRPRVVVTFHKEAAQQFAQRAARLDVELREPHPLVRRSEAFGWTLPDDAWGWPMGLVLLRDRPGNYDAKTLTWARKAISHILENTPVK